ncbi:Glycyl-tRNA_synthetase [Hexamita inflata]|uniref:glycine--tRNA ligase n=1 Tax=Hexamita inflata TaxID=28002 RepID=A0AA86UQN2_9EUKA|nr:Glycyl-tRNA synthetase [Hexamita inflata]
METKQKKALENVLTRRFFLAPAFEIFYTRGNDGLYDFGQCGTQIRQNVISQWRSHFVDNEDLQEISCPCLIPQHLQKYSGHVSTYTDLMITDTVTGEHFNAHQILKKRLQKQIDETTQPMIKQALQNFFNSVDGFSPADVDKIVTTHKITSEVGNQFSPCIQFDLPFKTTLSPFSSEFYLRPETAQGILVNFKRCYEQAGSQLPFGIAQIGTAFRNKISTANGLLSAREFQQAQIEYFIKNRQESVKNFSEVKDMSVKLLSYKQQMDGDNQPHSTTIREAIEKKIIDHEYLGYFIGRCWEFLVSVGIDESKLRFRQYLPNQHFAKDCWVCECLLNCGWTEIASITDRSADELKAYSKASGTDLSAFVKFDSPIQKELFSAKAVVKILVRDFKQNAQEIKKAIETNGFSYEHTMIWNFLTDFITTLCLIIIFIYFCFPILTVPLPSYQSFRSYKFELYIGESSFKKCNVKILVKDFKQNAQELKKAIETASQTEYERIQKELINKKFTINGFELPAESIQLVKAVQSIHGESITPIVIEFLFEIDKIVYSILEHSFYLRENDETKTIFKLRPNIAPCKCAVISFMQKDELEPITAQIIKQLRKNGISCRVDNSGVQISKKYARFDEIGIPYTVIVDLDSLTDKKVVIRERDSMTQIRVDIASIHQTINDLAQGNVKFEELK